MDVNITVADATAANNDNRRICFSLMNVSYFGIDPGRCGSGLLSLAA
jgi:hypothetical protein